MRGLGAPSLRFESVHLPLCGLQVERRADSTGPEDPTDSQDGEVDVGNVIAFELTVRGPVCAYTSHPPRFLAANTVLTFAGRVLFD